MGSFLSVVPENQSSNRRERIQEKIVQLTPDELAPGIQTFIYQTEKCTETQNLLIPWLVFTYEAIMTSPDEEFMLSKLQLLYINIVPLKLVYKQYVGKLNTLSIKIKKAIQRIKEAEDYRDG